MYSTDKIHIFTKSKNILAPEEEGYQIYNNEFKAVKKINYKRKNKHYRNN